MDLNIYNSVDQGINIKGKNTNHHTFSDVDEFDRELALFRGDHVHSFKDRDGNWTTVIADTNRTGGVYVLAEF